MSYSSALSLALCEADDGKRAGSVTEPNNSSASETARERLSSSSLSLTQNKIMSLAAAKGRWPDLIYISLLIIFCIIEYVTNKKTLNLESCWAKRKGECSLCGDGEARGHWAGVSSLVTGCSNPLPTVFSSQVPGRKKRGVRGAQSLSEKKAIWECREARLKISQWEHSVPLSAASAWDFPKHDTYSAWVSSACRWDLHILKWRCGICNKAVNFSLLVSLFGSTPDGCRGWPSLQAGHCEVLIRLLEAFQRRIPGSAKSQRRREFVAEEKKSEMRWQAADYIARRPSPPMHSHWLALHRRALVRFFHLTWTNHVQL